MVSDIPAGDRKIDNLFYSVSSRLAHCSTITTFGPIYLVDVPFKFPSIFLTVYKKATFGTVSFLSFLSTYCPGGYKEMSSIWLTNSALVYEPKCGGGGSQPSQPMSTVQLYTGAQINFGDITPYLAFATVPNRKVSFLSPNF
jgi:hypothetical protein